MTNLKDSKKEEAAIIYEAKGTVFFYLKALSGSHCGQIIEKIYPLISQKNCMVIGLSTIYKTNYSTPEGLLTIDSEKPYPIKYIKTSHQNAEIDGLLAANKEQIEADTAFNWQDGLTAALLMEQEMNGKAGVSFKCIVDQHFITSESLQGFAPIVNQLLGLKNVDMS